MNPDTVRATIVRLLRQIAPEADATALAAKTDLREALDLDSMDFLNFAIALHREFAIDIPEADYRKLATLEGCVAYVASRTTRDAMAPGAH